MLKIILNGNTQLKNPYESIYEYITEPFWSFQHGYELDQHIFLFLLLINVERFCWPCKVKHYTKSAFLYPKSTSLTTCKFCYHPVSLRRKLKITWTEFYCFWPPTYLQGHFSCTKCRQKCIILIHLSSSNWPSGFWMAPCK